MDPAGRSHPGGVSRIDVAVLVAVTCGFFAPFFRPAVLPIHDTYTFFEYFHYFYSTFYAGEGLPRWIPYGAYGYRSAYAQLYFLSPANYLTGLVGYLAGIKDALVLFKVSVLLEYLTMVVGLYLLATVLFRDRATRLLVCIGVAGSAIWYAQLQLNFRVVYLLPLLTFLMARFLRERRIEWLAGSGLVGIAWLIGNPPYLLPLWVLSCAVMAAIMARAWLSALAGATRRVFPTLGWLLVLALLSWAYVFLMGQGTQSITFTSAGRDAMQGTVDLSTFLTYGGQLDKRGVVRGLLAGDPTHLANGSGKDQSVYCGLLVLPLFLVAFVRVRDPWFVALCTAMLVLVLLSFAGGFARVMYWFPGMNYYRHLASVYGLVRTLLVVAAGFGAERVWAWTLRRQMWAFAVWACFVAAASVALGAPTMLVRLAGYAGAALLCLWIASLTGRPRLAGLKAGLVLGLLIDLASFQRVVFAEVPRLTAEEETFLVSHHVRPLVWQGVRSMEPATPESEWAWKLASRPGTLDAIAFSYTFAHHDPCTSQVRSDVMSTGVKRLLDRLPPGADGHDELFACGKAKLRVVRSVGDVNGERVDFPLASDHPSGPPPGGDEAASGPVPRVTDFSPNRLAAEVDVSGADEAWLVYADAYHLGWRAEIGGRPAKVFAAFDAMKAVRLSSGRNLVTLTFRLPIADALGDMFAIYGLVFSLVMLVVLCQMVFCRPTMGAGW